MLTNWKPFTNYYRMYEQEQTLIIQILTTENHIPIIGKISDGIISVGYKHYHNFINMFLNFSFLFIRFVMHHIQQSMICTILH